MATFYFDVVSGSSVAQDHEGADFPGITEAEEEARAAVLEIAVYRLREQIAEVSVVVRSAEGETVLVATASVAVTKPVIVTTH